MAKIKLDLTNDKSESSSIFSVVPNGTYKVTLAHSEFKDTTSGFGLTIGFMVEEGEHKGKLVRDFVNLKNSNPKASEIGRSRVKRIMEAQGRSKFILEEDTDLINPTAFLVQLEEEDSSFENSQGETVNAKQNRVKKITEVEGSLTKSVAKAQKEVKENKTKEVKEKEEAPKSEKKLPWEK